MNKCVLVWETIIAPGAFQYGNTETFSFLEILDIQGIVEQC